MKRNVLKSGFVLSLVLIMMLSLTGTVVADDPGPNDPPPTEPPPPPEPPIPPYGSGEGEETVVDAPPMRTLMALTTTGLITNGDFETNNFGGWGIYSVGSGGWYTYSGTYSPSSYHTIAVPPQGNYAATTDQVGPGLHILYQDISVPTTGAYNLSFTLYYHNWAGEFHTQNSLSHTVYPNQQYRVDIMDPAAPVNSVATGDVLANIFQTNVGDPTVLGPTPMNFDLSAFAGQTVRVRFASVQTVYFFNASVDDVQVTEIVPPTPPGVEPKTISDSMLVPGESVIVDKTVTTPAIAPKPDIYFLADTTGSMYGAIANVRENATTILSQVAAQANDPQFGAGNYKDFPNDLYAFQNNAVIDGQATALAAINSWAAGGGWDAPEAQLYALDQIAEGVPGWRSGSTKIVVWFGDMPGHDPVCSAISGLGYDITEASVTSKLVAAGIRVIAISVTSGAGLDLDPALYSRDYNSYCGTPGGAAGQASRIADATGGVHLQNVAPNQVTNAILSGLQNLPATVTPQLDSACSNELEYTFSPASQTVSSGDTALFVETIAVKAGAMGGLKTCTVDWLINGISAGSDFEQSISVHVDTPPEITSVTVTPNVAAINTPVNLVAEFTDPDYDMGDTHICSINWDDGTTEAGLITEPSASGPGRCTGTHSNSTAGIYNIDVTITDSRDISDSDSTMVVIYDPSAGFVTGGGWIYSPQGAYEPDPNLEGKANFGFVSKYKKGATVPTGNTEFQFHAAGLNFHSDTYEWLVVTGSNYAMFKGTGTINGMGEYKFMLWAGDDTTDTFRIKIWEEDEYGVETVIYDNGSDQAIGGGAIVIHKK